MTRTTITLALVAVLAVCFSSTWACAIPFTVFALYAAWTYSFREGMALITAVWAIDQVVGFTFLHYPLNAPTLNWVPLMLTIALGTQAAAYSAMKLLRRANLTQPTSLFALTGIALTCSLTFTIYEALCFGASLLTQSCFDSYQLPTVLHVAWLNLEAGGILWITLRLAYAVKMRSTTAFFALAVDVH